MGKRERQYTRKGIDGDRADIMIRLLNIGGWGDRALNAATKLTWRRESRFFLPALLRQLYILHILELVVVYNQKSC